MPIYAKIEPVKAVKIENGIGIDKLAKAVARHETKGCKLWYWAMYNNCLSYGGKMFCIFIIIDYNSIAWRG